MYLPVLPLISINAITNVDIWKEQTDFAAIQWALYILGDISTQLDYSIIVCRYLNIFAQRFR